MEVFPQASHAWNVTVVRPIGNAELTNGMICLTLSTPLQSVASGRGNVMLLSQLSTSTANVSISVHDMLGPSLSSAITMLAVAVLLAPHRSTTVHTTGIVAPHASIIIEASKSLETDSSVIL